MSDTDDDEIGVEDVVEDLSRLLGDLDPGRAPAEVEVRSAELQGRFRAIRHAVTLLAERTWPDPPGPWHWRLAELRDVLVRHAPEEGAGHRAWSEFRTHCEPAYRAFVASLGGSTEGRAVPAPAPSRPPNYVRNAYHVANAVVVVFLVQVVLTSFTLRATVATVGFVSAWGMEITRRMDPRINATLMRLFAPVAHPHEADHVNSATWYTTAILILAWLFPIDAGVVGLVVLGVADPAAAIVGRRYGRTPIGQRRTLEGTLAFVAVGFLGAAFVLWLTDHPGPVVLLALAGAVGGAVGEILSRRIDDNLMIPVLSAASVVGARWLGGVG